MMSVLLSLVILLSSIIWFVGHVKTNREKWKSLEAVPGPKPLPILGNIFDVSTDPSQTLKDLQKLASEYGNLFKLQVGPWACTLFVSQPEYLEKIVTSTTATYKGKLYRMFDSWIGRGLIMSNGSNWKHFRKLFDPIFNSKLMAIFAMTFNRRSRELVTNLESKVGDLFIIDTCLTDVAFKNVFESMVNDLDNSDQTKVMIENYKNSSQLVAEIGMMRYFSVKRFDWIFKLFPSYKTQKHHIERLRNSIRKLIRTKRQAMEQQPNAFEHRTILDVLMEAQRDDPTVTEMDIIQHLDTFMFAGHDTTAGTMQFGVYVLSKHPDVQERILKESGQAIPLEVKDAEFTMNQIDQLKYLDMFFKEVLRRYPTAPMLERTTCEELVFDKVRIPVGTNVVMMPYVLHNSPNYYPDPDKFDPERFSAENKKERHPIAYMPFSLGNRNCIGQRFATLEIKITLLHLIRNFHIKPAYPDFEVDVITKGTLYSKNGVQVILEKR